MNEIWHFYWKYDQKGHISPNSAYDYWMCIYEAYFVYWVGKFFSIFDVIAIISYEYIEISQNVFINTILNIL